MFEFVVPYHGTWNNIELVDEALNWTLQNLTIGGGEIVRQELRVVKFELVLFIANIFVDSERDSFEVLT